jgi:hypothetical protein
MSLTHKVHPMETAVEISRLPAGHGQTSAAIRTLPPEIQALPGLNRIVLRLANKDVTFNPHEPIVWVDAPPPLWFRGATLSADGRECTFDDDHVPGGKGGGEGRKFAFLLRVEHGGLTYLSTDPTIYNKEDQPPGPLTDEG